MAKDRENKGDKGVGAFTHAIMKDAFGLSSETASRVIKIIKEKGEYINMKTHIRKMSGATHKRFNQALDMAAEDMAKSEDAKDVSKEEKAAGKVEKKEKKEKETVKEGFLNYLLTELSNRDIAQDEIDSVGDKKERVNRARMSDATLKQTRTKELDDMKKSGDPIDAQILQLRNKIAVLQKKKREQGGE